MRRGNTFGRVCQSLCVSVPVQALTFESLDIGTSFSATQVHLENSGSSSYIKVIGSMSESQEQNVSLCPFSWRLVSLRPKDMSSISICRIPDPLERLTTKKI